MGKWTDHIPNRLIKPGQKIEWRCFASRRCWIATLNNKTLATIRRAEHATTWVAHIPGFTWDVSDSAKETLSRKLGIKASVYRGFESSAAARRAIEQAYAIIS